VSGSGADATPNLLLKVEGAGNDFVLGTGSWAERIAAAPHLLVARLCDRRRGIGAAGALAVFPEAADRLSLVYRNRDGSAAAFCANATRCAARVGVEVLGLDPRLDVHTGWVPIPARVAGTAVTLDLPGPAPEPRPLTLEAGDRVWSGWYLTLGVPHLVLAVADPDLVDLPVVAPPLRRHPALGPAGANVSFVSWRPDGVLAVRTWERGVEAETLACGSGVVAAALVSLAGSDRRVLACQPRSGDRLLVEARGGPPPPPPPRPPGPASIVARLEPCPDLLGE
jgi:diaminopimelate epimerase